VVGHLSHYSVTKAKTPIMETTRSVDIESLQQILDKGALTLDDTFTYSAGVVGKTFGFATRGDWLKVRGLDVPQYQDSLQSLFGNYNNTRADVYTLEQVEILKGPASVIYGKGSSGGIVNVVSKRPKSESYHEIVAEVGNFSRKQVAVDSTGAIDESEEWLYRFVGVYRDTETQVDFVEDQTMVFSPSITWLPNNETELTLLVNYTKTESDTAAQFLPVTGTLKPAVNGKHIEHSTYAGEPDYNKYDAETFAVTLIAEHEINDIWTVSLTSRYTDASADYQQAWMSFGIPPDRFIYNPDGSLYNDGTVPRTFYRNDATSEQKANDIRLRGEFDLGNWQHQLLIGTQYQDIKTDSAGYYAWAVGHPYSAAPQLGETTWLNMFNPYYGNIPDAVYAMLDSVYTENPTTKNKDLGIYISDQINVDDWVVSLGLRYDKTKSTTAGVSQKDNETSVSAGLMYKFDFGLNPYINYAESFDPVIGDNGNGQPLKPMRGEQVEVGVKYQMTTIPGMFTLAWFDIEQTNLPNPSSLPSNFEQQQGKANIQGVEFEMMLSINDLTIELNASHLDTESADDFKLSSVPEKQLSTWFNYRPSGQWQGFKSCIGFRYVGESYGGNDIIKTPSYSLADLMLGYEMDHWDFAINVRNLANKTFYASCLSRGDCFPGEERTIVARVKYVF